MQINVKHVIRDYKEAEICEIEIITKFHDEKNSWFMTLHLPRQPIGEAIEEHIRTFKIRGEIKRRREDED